VKIAIKFFLFLLFIFNVNIVHALQDDTVKQSRYSVGDTLDRLERRVKQKGHIVFSRIYHSLDAKKAGISLRPIQLLIFGKPTADSPLINENPLAALDLPLKVLVWQDEKNQAWLGYLNSAELKKRYKLHNSAQLDGMDKAAKRTYQPGTRIQINAG